MKKFVLSITIGILLSISLVASAGIWTGWGQIENIEEYGTGIRVIGFDLSANPAGCSSEASGYLDMANLTSEQIDRLNKMILSAFLSGREVRFKLQTNQCIENHPAIYAVGIK